MANFFVSYDLIKPEKNYEALATAIRNSSGSWARVQYSLWYVKANMTAAQLAQRLWNSMDANDKLLVIDASNNIAAWYNLDDTVEKYIKSNWHL